MTRLFPGYTVVTMETLLWQCNILLTQTFWGFLCFKFYLKNWVSSLGITRRFPQYFPVIVFPSFQRLKTKWKGYTFWLFHPSLFAFKHCANTCISLWLLLIIYLILWHTLKPDTSPQSQTKGSTQFSSSKKKKVSVLWQQTSNITAEGWIEGRQDISPKWWKTNKS